MKEPLYPRQTTWQLSPSQSLSLIVGALHRLCSCGQLLRIEGADLVLRPDLPQLVKQSVDLGYRVKVLARCSDRIDELGLAALASAGAFEMVLRGEGASTEAACEWSRWCARVQSAGMGAALWTVLDNGNVDQLEQLYQRVRGAGATRWIVGPDYAEGGAGLEACRLEPALVVLAGISKRAPINISVTYCPLVLRVVEREGGHLAREEDERWGLFVRGDLQVTPDPGIDWVVGNAAKDDLLDLFTNHPLLRALREPEAVEGKCGTCTRRGSCGGSRARALAVGGNLFASDPACTFIA